MHRIGSAGAAIQDRWYHLIGKHDVESKRRRGLTDAVEARSTPHKSDSREQIAAETEAIAALQVQLGVQLTQTVSIPLPLGGRLELDAATSDLSVLCEVFAHQGRPRGGQIHKVARDAFKLIYARSVVDRAPPARLVLCLTDAAAAAPFLATGWMAQALKQFSVDLVVIDLSEPTRLAIAAAQVRQYR